MKDIDFDFDPDSKDDTMYTTARVAEMFGVTPETVRDWIASGKLPGSRLGGTGQWRVKRKNLVRFANHRYGGNDAA